MTRDAAQWMARPTLAPDAYVDNRIYADAALFELEREHIFAKLWKFVCHENEIAAPGDYRTTVVAGTPLVIIRGDDGKIRSLYNVCPHRGAEIVRRPSGNGKNFTCLFHHWTFDRKGECVSIPLPDGYEDAGVSKEGQGLREVRTEIRLGLVFVNLDDGAESLDDFLGDSLENALDPLGSEELEVFHYHRQIVDGNWKNWVETDRELYHQFLHVINRTSSFQADGYMERGLQIYPRGHMATEPIKIAYEKYEKGGRRRRTGALPGMQPNESRVINLFPDFMINIRTTVIRLDSVEPLSPDRCVVEFRGLGIKGETAHQRQIRVKDHNEFWGPFGRNLPEDSLAVSEQMKTMRDGASPYSLYARNGRGGRAMDDAPLRSYYSEWSRCMGRSAHAPFEGEV